jgi:hypothetical protein
MKLTSWKLKVAPSGLGNLEKSERHDSLHLDGGDDFTRKFVSLLEQRGMLLVFFFEHKATKETKNSGGKKDREQLFRIDSNRGGKGKRRRRF